MPAIVRRIDRVKYSGPLVPWPSAFLGPLLEAAHGRGAPARGLVSDNANRYSETAKETLRLRSVLR